ncbi:MAG: hypothetical protein ABL912_04335 [Novosphingobium sp.]
MSQDDVLAKVDAARNKVAQTIGHAQASRDQVQQLLQSSTQHFSALNDDFNATLTHFQSEASRAREIAQEVIDALLKAAQEAAQAAQDSRQGLHDLTRSTTDATTQNDEGTAGLDAHAGQIADRKVATTALFGEVAQGTDESARDHQDGLDALGTAIGNWTSQVQAKSQEQHSALDATVLQVTDQDVPDFKQAASEAIETARAALVEQQNLLEQQSQQQVDKLRQDRDQASAEMESLLKEMGDALDRLAEFATSTSVTLVRGADEAKDLMSMTNVGVKTVIGLVENLQQIFNEIESAWS